MENILKLYYEKSRNLLLIKSLKDIIAESVSVPVEDMEYMDIKNGFCFVYDDETEGQAEITYGDKNNDNSTGYIKIKSEYPQDAVDLYSLIQQQVSAVEI